MIKLIYFASIREHLDKPGEMIGFEANDTIKSLLERLVRQQGSTYSVLLQESTCYALNQTLVERDALLKEGDELAVFPPVTGG